jgi:hypothetical protein
MIPLSEPRLTGEHIFVNAVAIHYSEDQPHGQAQVSSAFV